MLLVASPLATIGPVASAPLGHRKVRDGGFTCPPSAPELTVELPAGTGSGPRIAPWLLVRKHNPVRLQPRCPERCHCCPQAGVISPRTRDGGTGIHGDRQPWRVPGVETRAGNGGDREVPGATGSCQAHFQAEWTRPMSSSVLEEGDIPREGRRSLWLWHTGMRVPDEPTSFHPGTTASLP